jgi:hypothetical protein
MLLIGIVNIVLNISTRKSQNDHLLFQNLILHTNNLLFYSEIGEKIFFERPPHVRYRHRAPYRARADLSQHG